MTHTDGRPTIAWSDLRAWEKAPSNTASAVDPATTAACDGYPALREVTFAEAEAEALRDEEEARAELSFGGLNGACCGDPGDCNECGA